MSTKRATETAPLLIVQVEPPQQEDGGDYYYRTYAPGMAMAREKGVYVINLTNIHRKKDEIMRQADVLILKNICDADMLPLIKERKKKKKPTVYELADDICAIPSWNPVHFFFKNRENTILFKRIANFCNAVQFSVPELQRLYGYLNPCSKVFPNQITNVGPEKNYKDYKNVIVGWGGSQGHLEDIAAIAAPLTDWIMSRNDVNLYLMCSDSIWSLFEKLPQARKKRFKTGSLNDYYAFLKQIDIGLAPLNNSGFNRSRSDVKFLEYAAFGVVPVVQNAKPYAQTVQHDQTGYLFDDTAEMLDGLDMLVKNVACIPRIARAARQYVIKERLEHAHGKSRIAFYRSTLKAFNNEKKRLDAGSIFEGFSKIDGAVCNGRHLKLLSTPFENLLHDGLVLSQVEEEKVSACSVFSEAIRFEPNNYLPYLFGAFCSEDTAGWLHQAIERNPNSIKSWILMGEAYERQKDVVNSIKCYDSAARIFPEYEIPYLRTAALMQKLGHQKESDNLNVKVKELIHPLEFQN